MHALPIEFESGLIVSNHSCLCVIYCCTMGKVEILILFFFPTIFVCLVLCSLLLLHNCFAQSDYYLIDLLWNSTWLVYN